MNTPNTRFVDSHPHFTATLKLVSEAAGILRELFRGPALTVEHKSDGSPVTTADKTVDALFQRRLPELYAAPVVSEESPLPAGSAEGLSRFWLVDPLDGTKNFIRGEEEFSIVVALVIEGVPQLGFVAAPMKGVVFGAIRGLGVWRFEGDSCINLAPRKPLTPPLRVVTARFPKPEFLKRVKEFCTTSLTPPAALLQVGSAYKSMLLLEDRADLVLCFDGVSLWDLGGVECVLHEAGCSLRAVRSGEPICFDLRRGMGVPGYFAYHPEALRHFHPRQLGVEFEVDA